MLIIRFRTKKALINTDIFHFEKAQTDVNLDFRQFNTIRHTIVTHFCTRVKLFLNFFRFFYYFQKKLVYNNKMCYNYINRYFYNRKLYNYFTFEVNNGYE